jgi:hypothetical protein
VNARPAKKHGAVDPMLTLVAALLFALSVVLFAYGIRERRREHA